jgi:homoserine O-acetyltransferase/O-succinyltransferase
MVAIRGSASGSQQRFFGLPAALLAPLPETAMTLAHNSVQDSARSFARPGAEASTVAHDEHLLRGLFGDIRTGGASIEPASIAPAVADTEAAGTEATPPAQRGRVRVVLALRHSGPRELEIAYECVGSAHAPVVLVAGGISAHKHAIASSAYPEAGWWQAQSGHGLDPTRTRIVAIDWLGADGTLDAPIDAADQADAIAAVLDALDIDAVEVFVGASYGAMVGLQFAARYPQRLRKLIAISGAHRAHPYASAWRALQRQIVGLGQLQCDEAQGLSLARQLAMLSYRTPAEFAERFAEPPSLVHGHVRVAAEDYLEHCGSAYVARTSPTAFLRLSESIDLHRIDPATVLVPTIVVGVIEDRLVPIEDIYDLVEHLPNAEIRQLRSKFGHDAFLTETLSIANILEKAIQDAVSAFDTHAVDTYAVDAQRANANVGGAA